MKIKIKILVLIAAFYTNADTIVLKDGNAITCEVLSSGADVVEIKTASLGKISIPKTEIVSIEIISANASLANTLKSDMKNLEEKSVTWKDVNAKPAEPESPWLYNVDFNWNMTSGNKSSKYYGLKFSVKKEEEKRKILTSLGFEKEKVEGETQKDSIDYIFDYENIYNLPHSWYAKTEIERDKIRGIDFSISQSVGYGYYFLKNDDSELRFRGGLYGMYQEYTDDSDETTAGLDLGLYYMHKWKNGVKFVEDFNFKIAVNSNFYAASSDTYFECPLSVEKLSLKFGMKHDYLSETPTGIESLDSRYYLMLCLGWLEF